jgi:hypothetical protein
MELLPDFGDLSDYDLRALIHELVHEAEAVSYRRRILHGKIDILRAELVARLQKTQGRSVLTDIDIDGLEGGSGVREPRRPIKPMLDGTATVDPDVGDEPQLGS